MRVTRSDAANFLSSDIAPVIESVSPGMIVGERLWERSRERKRGQEVAVNRLQKRGCGKEVAGKMLRLF